jgi:hypothetical protein
MAKTQATLDIEKALAARAREKREYGCEEVTIGFKKQGHGDEIADFMTMDAEAVFQCYEIKISLADLKTENKKSFYGDYNYLAVSDALYAASPVWDNYIPPYAGILVGTDLLVKRKAKKRAISDETRSMLKDSLLRSVYWKMENYKDAEDLTKYRDLQKQLEQKEEALAQQARQSERMLFEYQDYEFYYRKNHQDPQFSIAAQAKEERSQAQLREKGQYAWIKRNNDLICPNCGRKAAQDSKKEPFPSDFCPYCGTDLRKSSHQ